MRLDKFLCDVNLGSRSQVKALIKAKCITVNDKTIISADYQINETKDKICCKGKTLTYAKFVYIMMNKPSDVVSATEDNRDKTVLDLLKPEDRRKDLFPVGRLDKDTEGFLLISNDGELSHNLLSPKKHVDKTYLVTIEHSLTEDAVKALTEGVDIGEKKPTAPATVEVLSETEILLTIHEGKFHQVKRMLQAVDNKVLKLKRVAFGSLMLDTALKPGEYRYLTEEELQVLQNA